ncbi:MAG: NAD(P)-binding domain-containing protein [Parasphingorhabdus sp.]
MRSEIDLGSIDTVVIGAGQAGLAMGYHLMLRDVPFIIVDGVSAIGATWRSRYDSLKLFTPTQYASLPGLTIAMPDNHYPSKDEVAEYLQKYAKKFKFDIRLDTRVEKLTHEDSQFVLTTNRGRMTARRVIISTGMAKTKVPSCAKKLGSTVAQLHSSEYKNPSQIDAGSVCIVGAGNSGAQIAEELAELCELYLSIDKLPKRLPQRLLGKDVFWWLIRQGVLDAVVEEKDRSLGGAPVPLIGGRLRTLLRRGLIKSAKRVVDADEHSLIFADGAKLEPQTIIWATGFEFDDSWIEIDGVATSAGPIQKRGVASVPGLYFVGQPWLYSKGSGFIGFVGRDAEYIARKIVDA